MWAVAQWTVDGLNGTDQWTKIIHKSKGYHDSPFINVWFKRKGPTRYTALLSDAMRNPLTVTIELMRAQVV